MNLDAGWAAIILALLTSMGALIGSITTARNSASRQQLENMERKAKVDAKNKADEVIALAEKQKAVDDSVKAEIKRLNDEILRQEREQDRYRDDIAGMRDMLNTRDREMVGLRLELSTERAVANTQSKRVSDLEAQMIDVLAYCNLLIDAMKKAGVPIPERQRPGTGPLPA